MFYGFELVVIAIMIFFNAIFAAYEMALASIPKPRIMALLDEKKRGAAEAIYMKERIGASLTVIQLGITLVAAFAAATGGAGIQETLAPALVSGFNMNQHVAEVVSLIVFIIPLTLITIVFAELIPKMFALSNREWVILQFSPFMKTLSHLLYPMVSSIEKYVKKVVGVGTQKINPKESPDKKRTLYELMAAASLARSSKLFGEQEEKIVMSAAHIATKPVRDIIIPAKDIATVFIEDSLTNAFLKVHMDMHTRFPVTSAEEDPQTIQGYVNFKDIMVAIKINPVDPTIKNIMRPITRVDENMPISNLLQFMIKEKTHITLVESKDKKVLGLVTMEDIIEELVGEIEDEYDRLPTHIHTYGDAWIIGGGVSILNAAKALGLDWTKKFEGIKVPSLAEWCEIKFGAGLKGAEELESEGLIIVPRKFRRKKLAEAAVRTAKNQHGGAL